MHRRQVSARHVRRLTPNSRHGAAEASHRCRGLCIVPRAMRTSGAPHTTAEHPFSSRHRLGPLGSQRSIRKSMMLREVTTGCCKFAMRRLSADPVEGSTEPLRFRQDVRQTRVGWNGPTEQPQTRDGWIGTHRATTDPSRTTFRWPVLHAFISAFSGF